MSVDVGYINRQHTVWCGCGGWDQRSCNTIAKMTKLSRADGWQKDRTRGWVCPNCRKKSALSTIMLHASKGGVCPATTTTGTQCRLEKHADGFHVGTTNQGDSVWWMDGDKDE